MASKTKGGATGAAKPKTKAKKSDAAKDRKKKGASAAAGTKPVQRSAPPQEQVRKMWGGKPLRDFAAACLVAQKRASNASGAAGQLITDKSKSVGLDGPSFRLVMRLYKKAKDDPVSGRTMYDNIMFYIEHLEIEKLVGDSLFTPVEVHSTKSDDGEEADDEDAAIDADDDTNIHEFPGADRASA